MAYPDFPDAGFAAIQVSLTFSGKPILRDMDFHVVPGEIHALVGKQNEGKTTFCRILTGELRPSSGWLLAGGRPYKHFTSQQARAIGVEYVGSQPVVFPDLTVSENLFTRAIKWWEGLLSWRTEVAAICDWLESYSIGVPYRSRLKEMPREDWLFIQLLSRLSRRPSLLLVDETLEQLPPGRFREVMPVVRDLLNNGMCLLWVTHKLEDALDIADRVTVLRQGRTIYTDHARNLDRVTLLRLSYSEVGEQIGEDVTCEQFYELMRFVEAMLRDMPVAVVICDMDRRVRFVNQSGKKLFPAHSNPIGLSLSSFVGEDNRRLADLADSSLRSSIDHEWHSLGVKSDQRDKLVDMRVRTIQERTVRIGQMLVIEDVTVREAMRRELALSENLASIGLLAAGVAHEVNDPLAIISNYLAFIRGESVGTEVAEVANLAQEETVRIQQIVDNLVAFSGNRPPNSAEIDIQALIRELCNLLRFHAGDRKVRFRRAGPDAPLWIRADPNEMRQVFLNLFRNSLDAIEEKGEIRVEARLDNADDGTQAVRIAVIDNGKGIQLDNPEDVFRPFTTTKKGKGSHQGLGLSIAYGIVEKYGGKIQAQNLSGGGCEFSLVFPLAEKANEE